MSYTSQLGSFPTTPVHTLTGHNGQVHALTYSSTTSTYLLTGSTDRTIRLFNPQKGNLIQKYTGAHAHEILDLAVNSDNTSFASVGGDKLVFLWDVAGARTLRRWEGHAGRVNAVAFAGDGDAVVVSGGYDKGVRCWDVKGGGWKAVMVLEGAGDAISAVAVPKRGSEILAASVDGKVRSWDVRMGRCVVDWVGYPVTSLVTTKAADAMLTTTLDSTLRLFDRQDGKLLQAFRDPDFQVEDYRVRSTLGMNDGVVISGSENGGIFVWDLLEGTVLHRLRHDSGVGEKRKGAKDVVSAVAYCPSGRREWCSAGVDGNVVVWGAEEEG